MKGKSKFLIIITVIAILMVLTATLSTMFLKNVNNVATNLKSAEHLRAMNYEEVTDEDAKVENCEYVTFSAFFTRDLNGDGDAEKLSGTCKSINEKDTLYLDLNVLSSGTLKNGVITINGTNFNYSMSMVKDAVLKYNYLSNDVTKIELNDISAGTQKLILGNIIADIGNNTNNYSNTTTITLTGTHVTEDGTETEINKKVTLTVDWYGEVTASLYTYSSKYYYDNLTSNNLSFTFNVQDTIKELLLKDVIATAEIPELNGYAPTSVISTTSGVVAEYDEQTRIITLTKSSTADDEGVLTNTLSRSNSFTVTITYPDEAFQNITSYTTLKVPVTGQNVVYNNSNKEFENPLYSNIATGTVKIVLSETPPTGEIYNFDIKFANKKYVSKPSYRYVISKQDLLNMYDNEDYTANFQYQVNWYAHKGNQGVVNSFVMSETESTDETAYGDKFDQTIMQEYITNAGIYFSGADDVLGKEGKIYVYNNDTDELIKEFTSQNWNTYTSSNLYKYSEEIKHIRVETTKPADSTTFVVHNIKELDAKKIVQNFTKEQIKDVALVYTYLTGVVDIEGAGETTVNDYDFAYYISETSYADITLSNNKITTQETTNEKIYIAATVTQTGDAKWKNGEFIVEVPEEIINMEINSVFTNNSDVKIVAYELYKENGKYFVKIITENNEPTTFTITIDSNITPDARISTTSNTFKLFAYNEYCNEYYYTETDIYDVDADSNVEELVGTDTVTLELLSPTSLITLETVSNYNEEGDITIAPNVAEVERETREATINIDVTNNYPNTITGVQILGKIPFEGNTYIINGKDLKSEFNTTMENSGIKASEANPTGVNENAVIYYSENEKATKDITDVSNGWMLLEEITDFSKIKTYLIDLQDYEVQVGKTIKFEYNVTLPENVPYNDASFSTHAVYYELATDGGNLSLKTEPNKVGVRIVNTFDLALTKYKINSNITIPGVTYALKYQEEDAEGVLQEKTRILTTNSNGQVILKNLNAEIEYNLQEIKVPNTCEKNTNIVTFKINEDLTVTLNGEVKNYEFTTGEILNISLEDEIKYNFEINKTKIGSSTPISGVRFSLEDSKGNIYSVRTINGMAVLEGLSLNEQYTLTEAVVPGNCEKNNGKFTFKLIRNSSKELELQTVTNTLLTGTPKIQDSENILTPVLDVNVQNEIKYSLNILKQDTNGNVVEGAEFTIKGTGFSDEGTKYISTKDGNITISGLSVAETYTIEEVQAIGYYLDNTKDNTIQFRVDRTSGNMQITSWVTGDGIAQVGTQTISETDLTATLSVVLENEKIPTYSLEINKQNGEGEILPGAQFKLTSLDTDYEQIITIDENGKGVLEDLYLYVEGKSATGEYLLKEIYAPDGYVAANEVLKFKASKNNEGIIEVTVLEGSSLLKLDETTKEPVISTTENEVVFTIVNEPVFSLKKYGDGNTLLPNAKFVITDLDGNSVTDALGNTVGTLETINNEEMYVVTTDENGEVSVNLPEGLYKAVEVQAPTGYELPANEEDRTYYFGIGSSRPQETSGTIDSIEWAKSVKSNLVSEFNDAVETNDGGIIAVGRAKGSIDINGDGIPEGTDVGSSDAIIVKYNQNGAIQWSKVVGGINEDEFFSIAKIPTGGYVIGGYTSTSEVTINGNMIDVANYGNEDGIILKIDENGNYLWSQSIGGTAADRVNDVAVAEDGTIAVVGSYYSNTCYLDKNTVASNSISNTGEKDGFISVYSSDGEYRWSQNIGGTLDNWGEAVIAASNGFAVAANFDGTVSLDTSASTTVATKGLVDGIVISYSLNGTYQWHTQIGGATYNDTLEDIIVVENKTTEGEGDSATTTTTRNIIVSGSYASSIDINADGTNDLTTKGLYDGMIVTLNETDGAYVKSFSIGGTQDETISSIYETKDGGLLFGGWYYSSSVDLDKDGTNDIRSKSGESDGLIVKLSADDEVEWFDRIYGNSYDSVNKAIQPSAENSGYIAVGKYMSSSLTAMGQSGILTNSRFSDAFIIKYGETVTTSEIAEAQEVIVENNLVEYKITTEVLPNNDGERIGGTITGIYSDLYKEENHIRFVESVKYEYDNAKNIVITPDTDYYITKLTINGIEYSVSSEGDDTGFTFVPDENGKVTIPAGYFTDIKEDIHIAVGFSSQSHSIIIQKVDSQGESVEGATFEVKTNNKTPVLGDLTANGSDYVVQDTTKDVSNLIGSMQTNEIYAFKEVDGKYVSDNAGISNSSSNSYIEIDLTGLSGNYTLKVNAELAGSSSDYAYASINEYISMPSVYTSNRFISTNGNRTAKDYSKTITGGKKYYLNLEYKKGSATTTLADTFTINSITLTDSSSNDVSNLIGTLQPSPQYGFDLVNGKYVSNNTAKPYNAANGFMEIDLTSQTGTYFLNVDTAVSGSSSDYGFVTVNNTQVDPLYNNSTNRIVYINNSQTSNAFTELTGGNKYYVHFGYYKYTTSSTNSDIFTINSVNLYESQTRDFWFDEADGTYTSNNTYCNSTIANSYIPLDLTNYIGKYELTVNAQITATSSDYGFVTVKETQTAPTYDSSIGRLMLISGTVDAKDYTLTLTGGKMYYIHLGYVNGSTNATNTDQFKINSIDIAPVQNTYTVTTDSEGQAVLDVYYGNYTIQEIEAPEGFVLSDEIHEVLLLPEDKIKTVTIENERNPKIIVHHYLKDGNTYTTTNLADDEITEGVEGEEYTTSPRTDIENYILEKDENGKFVIPLNASGTFAKGDIIITYYYEEKPVILTVHHYLEGTEDKLAEDEVESLKKGSDYETSESEELLKDYELVSVEGTETGTITEDTVVTYYYKKKVHSITTEVVAHTEQRTDSLLNQKVEVEVLGGTITGSFNDEYLEENGIQFVEQVAQKENSIAKITATPDDAYIVKSIKLISVDDTDNATETLIYGENAAEDAEISATLNADGSVELSLFTIVVEDKHVVVEFEPVVGTVITHHIIKGETTDYATTSKKDLVGEPYQTGEIDIEHYKLVETSENTTGNFAKDDIHVYYYYDKKSYAYSVHYFYDGVEDTSEIEKGTAEYLSKITEYEDKVRTGYILEKAEPENAGKDGVELTITDNPANNVINVYYVKDNFGYSVHYFYDGIEDESEKERFSAAFGEKIVTYKDKIRNGYKLEKIEPLNSENELEMVITEKPEDNVINVYYIKDKFNYTVEYYYDGIIDSENTDVIEATFDDEITTYIDKVKPGYVLTEEVGVPLKITSDEDANIIKIYYRTQYNVTTEVITHTEEYVDGTVKQDVKGGKISGDDLNSYEEILKGENNTKEIVITPDEDYEIVRITINNTEVDYSSKVDSNGVVTIPSGYFENVQEDKHIEVEFRKKSNVIVRYLEKDTNEELLTEEEILGYETKEYTTSRKDITYYQPAKDENGDIIPANAVGNMKADTIIVTYYYEKISAGIIVKHLEKLEDEDGNISGVEIEGIGVEAIDGFAGEEIETSRKTIDGYISAEAPENSKEDIVYVAKDENEKIVIFKQDVIIEVVYWYEKQFEITTDVIEHEENIENSETGASETVSVKGGAISGEDATPYEYVSKGEDNSKEIVIVPDDGYRVKELIINGNKIDITELEVGNGSSEGTGNESGEGSEEGAGKEKAHTIKLPVGYFEKVQENKHVEVEFEKIPAKVFIQYIDIDTKEHIIPQELLEGFVNDEYTSQRKEFETYIKSDPEPENANGKMSEEDIVVIYYYKKQFKVTTDVKEHFEFTPMGIVDLVVGNEEVEGENQTEGSTNTNEIGTTEGSVNSNGENVSSSEGNLSSTGKNENSVENNEISKKVSVKGGTISGEDETPYETVPRGLDNSKEIVIKPDAGYKIKSIAIVGTSKEIERLNIEEILRGKEIEGIEVKVDEKSTVDAENSSNTQKQEESSNEENQEESFNVAATIILKAGYFKNFQTDIHVVVEFERIPSRVIAYYLDSESQKNIAKFEIGNGYVNSEYKTYAKEIPYYLLIEDKLPANAVGKLTEKDTIVNYWYRKLLFNMKLTKEFSSIKVNGVEMLKEDKKFAKVDVTNTEVDNTNILVKYIIRVTNTEEVEGVAKVVESIPVGFKFVDTENAEVTRADANSNQQVNANSGKTSNNTNENVNQEVVENVENGGKSNAKAKWKEVDGKLELTTRTLKPGETAEYEITLEWDKSLNCMGILTNTALISQTENIPQYQETTKEDNKDSCTLILAVRTREDRDVKTIISMSCFILAGICTVVYVGTEVWARRKENE